MNQYIGYIEIQTFFESQRVQCITALDTNGVLFFFVVVCHIYPINPSKRSFFWLKMMSFLDRDRMSNINIVVRFESVDCKFNSQ